MRFKHAVMLSAAVTVSLGVPASGTSIPTAVEVGGDGVAGTHPFTASAEGSLVYAMEKNDGSYLTLACSLSTIPTDPVSTLNSGPAVSTLARVNAFKSTCSGPGASWIYDGTGSWKVHRTGGTVSAPRSDVLRGHIDDVQLSLTSLICKYDVTGRAAMTFDEGTQVLTLNEQGNRAVGLTMSNIVGCGGQLKHGGKLRLTGKLKITSPDGPINAVP